MQMNDKQSCPAGVTILDLDGKPLTMAPTPGPVFTSDHSDVADFVVGPDGLNGTITSGVPGTAKITATLNLADGTALEGFIDVVVVNSDPGSINFTAGTPVDETPKPA